MSKMEDKCRVPLAKLRWACPGKMLKFKTTKEVKPWSGTFGQERAQKALEMGLRLHAPGYNLFVTGISGTGRLSTIRSILEKLPDTDHPLEDLCYVYNFRQPDNPVLLHFAPGRGREFLGDMEDFIEHLRKNIPIIFEDENYVKRREALVEEYQQKENALFRDFEEKLKKEEFLLIQYPLGSIMKLDIAPAWEGQPINFQQLDDLVRQNKIPAERAEKIKGDYSVFKQELNAVLRKSRALNREMSTGVEKMAHETALLVVEGFIDDLQEKYKSREAVGTYLKDVLDHVLRNLNRFSDQDVRSGQAKVQRKSGQDPYLEYRANLVLENSATAKAPVIIETYPTYTNLFGSIEKEADRSGYYTSDFTKIKGGSVLAANGGYLIVQALDALIEPGVWKTLKRVLKSRLLEIQSFDSYLQLSTSVIKPEPIPVNLKVIMIGDPYIYNLLYNFEDDFKKIFKVKVDFDTEINLSEKYLTRYASFIKRICDDEKLLPVAKDGVAAVIEYGVREAGRQDKITSRLGKIADLVREANFWALQEGSAVITRAHIEKAIDEGVNRHNLVAQRLQEMIDNGTIFIDTQGGKVGQVNGLAVYNMGDYAFGKPCRITATVATGRAGIINIEREAELSGSTHDKGVYILTGYLRDKFTQDAPLALSASICFEQSYGTIDGDSASSTEIYALLSALSGLPLRQDLAVTGSLNQKGEIQPIGGVNLKVESFYDTCKARGLSGSEGVLIPASNVPDLMLRPEVVQAVREGQFHLFAVSTVEEGIELLTGVKAGTLDKGGKFPADTAFGKVAARLKTISENLARQAKEAKSGGAHVAESKESAELSQPRRKRQEALSKQGKSLKINKNLSRPQKRLAAAREND